MTEIAQMLETLKRIETLLGRIETMLVAIIAEAFEEPQRPPPRPRPTTQSRNDQA
jgi:hypothetical protein